MDITPYFGKQFECGSGKKHSLNSLEVEVLRELVKMRLVLKVIECNYLNCVKIKGFFKIRLKTLFSAADGEWLSH